VMCDDTDNDTITTHIFAVNAESTKHGAPHGALIWWTAEGISIHF